MNNYGIEQKEQEEGLNINYCIMLPREVSFCNFFQLNVRKSDPGSIRSIDVDSILNKLLAA